VLSVADFISEFDAATFCGIVALDHKVQYPRYCGAIAQALAQMDVELAANLFDDGNILNLSTPINATRKQYSATLLEKLADEEINTRIWKAQVSVLLPIIERAFQRLLKKYTKRVEEAIARKEKDIRETDYTPIIDPTGNPITDIKDIQLGTMNYMVKYRGLKLDKNDESFLCELTECRNIIAHTRCCSSHILRHILDLESRD